VLPLSYIASGAISKVGATMLFVVSGVTVIAIAAVFVRSPSANLLVRSVK